MNKLRNYAWYSFNDQDVIIVDDNNEKFQAIESIETNPSSDEKIISINDCEKNNIEITKDDVHCSYGETYGEIAGSGEEIVLSEVANVENNQMLLNVICTKTYADDDSFERNLLTNTDSYFQWQSERTEFIDDQIEKETDEKTALNEWKKIENKYHSAVLDYPDFSEIWNEIEYGRNTK